MHRGTCDDRSRGDRRVLRASAGEATTPQQPVAAPGRSSLPYPAMTVAKLGHLPAGGEASPPAGDQSPFGHPGSDAGKDTLAAHRMALHMSPPDVQVCLPLPSAAGSLFRHQNSLACSSADHEHERPFPASMCLLYHPSGIEQSETDSSAVVVPVISSSCRAGGLRRRAHCCGAALRSDARHPRTAQQSHHRGRQRRLHRPPLLPPAARRRP